MSEANGNVAVGCEQGATRECPYCGEPFEPRSPTDAEWKPQGLPHEVPTGGLGRDFCFSSNAAVD